MKIYQQQAFKKNNLNVNAVYIVKKGDTKVTILNSLKKFGANKKDTELINPSLKDSVTPGEYIYFQSTTKRFPEQENQILNIYELQRTPFALIEIKSKSDFKSILDKKLGYKNAWEHVFVTNKLTLDEFKSKPSHVFKIFASSEEVVLVDSNSNGSFDKFFLRHQGGLVEGPDLTSARSPASTVVSEPSATVNQSGVSPTVYIALSIISIALLVLIYKGRKKEKRLL